MTDLTRLRIFERQANTMRCYRYRVSLAIAAPFALFGLVLAAPGVPQAQEAVPPPRSASGGIPLKDLLAPQGVEREQQLNSLIEQALAAKSKAGTVRRLEGRRLERLSPQQAALTALKKNLALTISRAEAGRAQKALFEAEAVFDPVFTLNVGYQDVETHERTRTGTVNAQVFQPAISGFPGQDPELGSIILTPEARALTGIERIVFPNVRSEVQQVEQTVFASRDCSDIPNGCPETYEYSVALAQQLPWGARFDVSVITTDQDVFYDNRDNSFGASWSSNLLFNLEVPLPGGRDFGPYAVFDTQVKLADNDRERTFWALQSTLNDTLLAVDLTYLDLLQNLENLQVAIENRKLLERQSAHTAKLYEARFATTYDKAQIEGEVALARAQEEAAANAFLAASDALAILIEDSDQAVRDNIYLPTGYTPWLDRMLSFDEATALDIARRHRPALQVSRVELEASGIVRRNAVQQTRPDVTLSASIEARQDGSVYGYKSYGESLSELTNPDTLSQSYAVRYRYPFGNRALKARLAQADGQLQDTRLGLRTTHNDVVQGVNDALSSIKTARARIARAEQQLDAARTAYNGLARRAEKGGDVNENELIITIRRLLSAKLARIAAAIDNKRGESRLLGAQGTLPRHFGGWTSRNAFERYRLKRLAEGGEFEYFLE